MIYFTSDTHFNHKAIIHYCNRPFETVEEMNDRLIENWNKVVKPSDSVYHLGDFALYCDDVESIRKKLNGKIHLIKGNHDKTKIGKYFNWFGEQIRINYMKQDIILNHYPLLTYAGCYTKTWNLFGHVHTCKISNGNPDITRMNFLLPRQYDVGVDNNNYTPISFDEINEIIKKQLENEYC